jgi:hypothetical protein
MNKATKKTPTTPATITLPPQDRKNAPQTFAATTAAAPVEQAAEREPEYMRTADDKIRVSKFIDAARVYERASHTFATAAYLMMSDGLHTREGFDNFGQWCVIQFKAHDINSVEARRAYQLAQIGQLLNENKHAVELVALPSRALLAMAQNEKAVEDMGGAAAVAAALPEFMKAHKIGDTAAALTEFLEHGPEGDQRTREERKADADFDARMSWMVRGSQLAKGNAKRAEELAREFIAAVKDEEKKRTTKKARRSTSRRTE